MCAEKSRALPIGNVYDQHKVSLSRVYKAVDHWSYNTVMECKSIIGMPLLGQLISRWIVVFMPRSSVPPCC